MDGEDEGRRLEKIKLYIDEDITDRLAVTLRSRGYDAEHGFAHRDLFDKRGNKKKTPMFTEDYNEALTFAEYDIKSNWEIYKKAFLGGAEDEDDNR